MRRLAVMSVMWLAYAGQALGAEKLPPLDREFLEYLASFGSDEEDWALFADEDDPAAEPPAQKPVAKPDESETAAKPVEQR